MRRAATAATLGSTRCLSHWQLTPVHSKLARRGARSGLYNYRTKPEEANTRQLRDAQLAAFISTLHPTLSPSDKIGGEICGTSKAFAVFPWPLGDRLQQAAARRRLVFGFLCGVANQDLRTSAFKGSSHARDRTVVLRVAGVQTQTRTRTWTAADADVPWMWTCRGRGRAVNADVPRTRTRLGRGRQRARMQLGRGRTKPRADADVLGRGRATDTDATRTRTFCP